MLRLNNLICIPNKKPVVCGSSQPSHTKYPSIQNLRHMQHEFCTRGRVRISQMYCTCSSSSSAVSSGVVNTGNSNFDGIAVATTLNSDSKELKISVVVSGAKTQSIFDDVFSKIVADSQPIPGFRRVKGGTTPNIPKFILLEVLGQSRIYRQAISKIINYAIAGFVEKESLKVSKNLVVEQSIEESEAEFEPGEDFKFDAVLQLLD
ncbi:hypothetical protein QQ045_030037 [Rhodiola kirilowii]